MNHWKRHSTSEEAFPAFPFVYSASKRPLWLFNTARTQQSTESATLKDLLAHFQAPSAHGSSGSLGAAQEQVKLLALLLLLHHFGFLQPAALDYPSQRSLGCLQQLLGAPSFTSCLPDQ